MLSLYACWHMSAYARAGVPPRQRWRAAKMRQRALCVSFFSCAYLCCVSIRIYFGLSVSICCVSIRIYFGFCVSSFPFPIIWKVGLKKRRTVCIAPTHATRSSARIPHNIFWGCHGPYDPYESHSAVHIGAATGFNMKYVFVNHGKLL